MLLLIMRDGAPGKLEAIEIDDANEIAELRKYCRLIVDVMRDPIYVLHDMRRSAVPYIPAHRELENWLRTMTQALL